MSHPVGTYLGGIRSVEDLRLRSRICEESGCWRYGLAVSDNGAELSVLVEGERLRCRGRAAAVMMRIALTSVESMVKLLSVAIWLGKKIASVPSAK